TVNGTDARHFQPSDLPLLTCYCRTAAMERDAAAKLARRLVAKGKPSPMVAVHASLARTLVSLSIRLRLAPKSRAVNTPTRPNKVSSYGQTAMPMRDDVYDDDGNVRW